MATKVLVFESDAAFANELMTEFKALGSDIQVVDDGNLGLQLAATERPDLILLSIELPRMNGFSICNKLKKDDVLKDIPLIIMSSDSNEETFEQHRRLRTRAEDYIHKPIAFADLLERVQRLVDIGSGDAPASTEDAIIIDDDIAFENGDDDDDDDETHTMMMDRMSLEQLEAQHQSVRAPAPPDGPVRSPSGTLDRVHVQDLDVDEFADAAFDRLLDGSQPPPAMDEVDVALTEPPQHAPSFAAEVARPATIPSPPELGSEEVGNLLSELERYRDRAVDLEKDLASARAESQMLTVRYEQAAAASAEVERLQRQVDELKSRASASIPARGGGVSSREFLDLRETLNNKDKEILALRDQMSHKEKELLDARDANLALEREKADHQDKLLDLERQALDLRMLIDRLTVEKQEEQTKAQGLEGQLSEKTKELEDREQKLVEAEQRRLRELEELRITLETKGLEALDAQSQEMERAKGAMKAELDAQIEERDGKIRGLEADKSELESRVTHLEGEVSERDGRISGLEGEKSELLSKVAHLEGEVSERDGRISGLESEKGELGSKVSELQGDVEQRNATIAKLSTEKGDLESKVMEFESRMAEQSQRIDGLEEKKSQLEAKVVELDSGVQTRDETIRQLEGKVSGLESDVSDRDSSIGGLESDKQELSTKLTDALDQASQKQARIEELDAQVSDQKGRIGTLEASKEQLESNKSELESELDRRNARIEEISGQLREKEERIGALEADVAAARSATQEVENQRNERDDRIRDLESSLAKIIVDRDVLTDEKQALTTKTAELEQQLGETFDKLQQVEGALVEERERAQKSQSKWNQDKASLDRAKNALAAVLMQIEEVETRDLE